MAPNTTDTTARLTPLAALLNVFTLAAQGKTLGTYLAVARVPGTEWKSFDDIAADLTAMAAGSLDRPLNRVSIKTYAESYGIPDTRYVEGRSMPRPVSDAAVLAYLRDLRDADRPGVDFEAVATAANEAQDRDRAAQEAATQTDTGE